MFGLVPATLAIDRECGGALLKRASKRIDARHGEGYGLDDSSCAPLLGLLFLMEI